MLPGKGIGGMLTESFFGAGGMSGRGGAVLASVGATANELKREIAEKGAGAALQARWREKAPDQ